MRPTKETKPTVIVEPRSMDIHEFAPAAGKGSHMVAALPSTQRLPTFEFSVELIDTGLPAARFAPVADEAAKTCSSAMLSRSLLPL